MYLLFLRMGWMEILLIAAVIVLIFGTSRFGQLKNSFLKAARNLRQSANGKAEE